MKDLQPLLRHVSPVHLAKDKGFFYTDWALKSHIMFMYWRYLKYLIFSTELLVVGKRAEDPSWVPSYFITSFYFFWCAGSASIIELIPSWQPPTELRSNQPPLGIKRCLWLCSSFRTWNLTLCCYKGLCAIANILPNVRQVSFSDIC